MRLREKDKRGVTIVACTGFDDDVYLWAQEGSDIRAAVYPGAQTITQAVQGDKKRETKTLLYDRKDVMLEVGMGVSLDGKTPAYRIVSVEEWDHQAAVLERIEEGRRGQWG